MTDSASVIINNDIAAVTADTRRKVCWDFDGVVHRLPATWRNGLVNGEAIEGVRECMEKARARLALNVVLTARPNVEAVAAWLDSHGYAGLVEYVTNVKPPAVVYVDDRGLHFDSAVGVAAELEARLLTDARIRHAAHRPRRPRLTCARVR